MYNVNANFFCSLLLIFYHFRCIHEIVENSTEITTFWKLLHMKSEISKTASVCMQRVYLLCGWRSICAIDYRMYTHERKRFPALIGTYVPKRAVQRRYVYMLYTYVYRPHVTHNRPWAINNSAPTFTQLNFDKKKDQKMCVLDIITLDVSRTWCAGVENDLSETRLTAFYIVYNMLITMG